MELAPIKHRYRTHPAILANLPPLGAARPAGQDKAAGWGRPRDQQPEVGEPSSRRRFELFLEENLDEDDKLNLLLQLEEFQANSCDLSELLTSLLKDLLVKIPSSLTKFQLLSYIRQLYVCPRDANILRGRDENNKLFHDNESEPRQTNGSTWPMIEPSEPSQAGEDPSRSQLDVRLLDAMIRRYSVASRLQMFAGPASTLQGRRPVRNLGPATRAAAGSGAPDQRFGRRQPDAVDVAAREPASGPRNEQPMEPKQVNYHHRWPQPLAGSQWSLDDGFGFGPSGLAGEAARPAPEPSPELAAPELLAHSWAHLEAEREDSLLSSLAYARLDDHQEWELGPCGAGQQSAGPSARPLAWPAHCWPQLAAASGARPETDYDCRCASCRPAEARGQPQWPQSAGQLRPASPSWPAPRPHRQVSPPAEPPAGRQQRTRHRSANRRHRKHRPIQLGGSQAGAPPDSADEEESDSGLSLVPAQARGRLSLSVAEQMRTQANNFVHHYGSSGDSASGGPTRRPSRRPSLQVRRTLRVKIKKSKPILGIAIEGGFNVSGQLLPRIVCVHEDGAAYQCGKLRASDLILEVNGTSTVNMTHDEIAKTIADAYYQDPRPYVEFLVGESIVL